MFGSRRWRFNAASVSACILRGSLNYATVMGIICFRVKKIGSDNRLVAKNRKWYKWFCLISRIVMCGLYIQIYRNFMHVLNASHYTIILIFRVCIYIACAVFTLVIQFWYGERVVDLVNRFLRLFQRIHALPGCQDVGFGDKWVLILLLLKVISRIYESCYLIPVMMPLLDSYHISTTICDFYNTVNAAIILHFNFVAYLSIGIAYDRVNSFVRHELRQQLCELNSSHGFSVRRRKLKAVGHCLDECLAIYDEIAQVGNAYHRLFEFPLCIFLSYGFLSLATIAFIITLNLAEGIRLWLLTIQILLDILLLTTAVHIASSNSRVVQRLSLENYYVSVDKDWHMKLEMFLCRLNYNEFRVRPLGLFEVSNQLILVFMSGLATYLTYIIQYDMKSNPT
ncbi:PREDICTED: putative gustatory receptor 93c [Drosophila arizonae]|uniref:Gustatory receptor n=1 Tax=Drosophila arizonae TaxID=7263 RepID=A0ABM1PSD7_DROAR|nr:PREDICTED: putative gustatory receptor 93c [Drosophila arizonae]